MIPIKCPKCGFKIEKLLHPPNPSAIPTPKDYIICANCLTTLKVTETMNLIEVPATLVPYEIKAIISRLKSMEKKPAYMQ